MHIHVHVHVHVCAPSEFFPTGADPQQNWLVSAQHWIPNHQEGSPPSSFVVPASSVLSEGLRGSHPLQMTLVMNCQNFCVRDRVKNVTNVGKTVFKKERGTGYRSG